MITAPYNFVPLNKEVFYPDWSEQVSHDVPFADGESGEIDITITAKSPIFIRDHEKLEEFCQYNGQYYIPSTSIKGMVRNVLEIMSFGVMITDKNHGDPMSIRDMSNSKELVGVATGCGFLKKDEKGSWVIIDYGKPRTIEYSDKKNKTFVLNGKSLSFTLGGTDNMSAQQKYDSLGSHYYKLKVSCDVEDLKDRNGRVIGKKPVAKLQTNGTEAYLICTGEITNKEHEFVFVSADRKDEPVRNIDTAVKKFQIAYFESDSIDGSYWKKHYDPQIGIPVFYKKQVDKITDIGLTQLFKLLYPHSIKSAINQTIELIHTPNGKKDNKLDLAQAIFGTTRQEASSLKGRAYFSHFKTTAKPQPYIKNLTMTLGGPKPSFYPTYIQQNCNEKGKVLNNEYNTLMKQSTISGWKQYPLHHNMPSVKSIAKSDTTVTFNPLGTYNSGVFEEFSFSGKLRYHNLRPEELGAIISALTFHDNALEYSHNIGLAKAHGFGKIAIEVDTLKYQKALKSFEAMMTLWTTAKLNQEWLRSSVITELFAMHCNKTNNDNKLKYLILDPDKTINEFSDAKNIKKRGNNDEGRDCLPKYSVLSKYNQNVSSLLDENYYAEIKIQQAFEQASKTNDLQVIKNFLEKHPEHSGKATLQARLVSIEKEKQQEKFAKINEEAQKGFDAVMNQKDKNTRRKYAQSWIAKWSKPENHKDSTYILELIEKAKTVK